MFTVEAMFNTPLQRSVAAVGRWLGKYWPYLAFLLFVVVYNVLYLPKGFRPSMDEGYLQSLAARVLDGELPYRDFYFFRTPLSIYIQAGMIWLLGSHYTILAARIFCVAQTTTLVLLVSSVYFRLAGKLQLLLLLAAGYLVGTLMLDFPWYTYDGVFFAVIGLVMYHRRNFFLFGLAVFLAGLSKQNFVGLLVLVPVLSFLAGLLRKDLVLMNARQALRFFSGFALPALFYGGFLLATHRVESFFQNVIFLPRECSRVTLAFTLFQNHADAFTKVLALVFAVIMLFYASRERWLLYVGAAIAGAVFLDKMWNLTYEYSYAMVYLSYTVAVLVLLEVTKAERFGGVGEDDTLAVWKAFTVALIIQYLSGFNYGGLIFSHIGAGVSVPLAVLLLSRMRGSSRFRLPVYVLLAAVILVGVHLKTRYVYHDASLPNLTKEFSHPMLKGIYSSPANVDIFEKILATVSKYSEPGEPIFVFPDHPALYFLTGRRNPTPIEWYYHAEYNAALLNEAVKDLRRTPPKVVFVPVSTAPKVLTDFLNAAYRQVDHLGQLDVLVPVDSSVVHRN